MSDFKIGDKVKVITDCYFRENENININGLEGVIHAFNDSIYYENNERKKQRELFESAFDAIDKRRLNYLDSPAIKKASEIITNMRIEKGEKCKLELSKNNLNNFYKSDVIKNTYCKCALCETYGKDIKDIDYQDLLELLPSYSNLPSPPKRPDPPQPRWQKE